MLASSAVSIIFSPVSTQVLFQWPMWGFKTKGLSWIDQMHEVINQRVDTLAEYTDLEVRFWAGTEGIDFIYAQQMVQESFLEQVFLMILQKEWQGEQFAYRGEAIAIIEQAQDCIQQMNEKRNPLGLTANQVFFESSDVELSNWEFYRKQILDGPPGGGYLTDTENAIELAVYNLQESLKDRQEFETQIMEERQHMEEKIDDICGEDSSATRECPMLTAAEMQTAFDCTGPDCADSNYTYKCVDNLCELQPAKTFMDDALDIDCDLEFVNDDILIDGRHCVNGAVGELLELRSRVELQQTALLDKLTGLLGDMEDSAAGMKKEITKMRVKVGLEQAYGALVLAIDTGLGLVKTGKSIKDQMAGMVDCVIVAGLAGGTDCPQGAAKGFIEVAGEMVFDLIDQTLDTVKAGIEFGWELGWLIDEINEQVNSYVEELEGMADAVGPMIHELQVIYMQLREIQANIKHQRYLAKQAIARYNERVGNVVDHLTGKNSGNVLHGNKYVQTANNKFRDLLRVVYKMTMTFGYKYNLDGPAEPYNLQTLINMVYTLMTPDDVREYIALLDYLDLTYCGREGIDCDSASNQKIFKFSVRDQLFPHFRDIVDPHSGTILTRGEQFHNMITSSIFKKRRTRPGVDGLVDQIEIPFGVWLNAAEGAAEGAGFMLSPFECNHILGRPDGTEGGNFAVYMTGRNVRPLQYEMWRGDTDYMKACRSQEMIPPGGGMPLLTYPVNVYTVGYSPESSMADRDAPPSYVTNTGYLRACEFDENNGSESEIDRSNIEQDICFNYFSRDRSLAAPDWKVVLPLEYGSDNHWILNDGVPKDERAIIDDIVIYFRYKSRPMAIE